MYRPNRIGPHMLVDIDRAPKVQGAVGTSYSKVSFIPVTPDQTIRDSTASRQINGTFTAITADECLAVAIAIKGNNPVADFAATQDPAVQYSIAASITWRDAAALNAGPPQLILGRNDAATLAATPNKNASANFQNIPLDYCDTGISGGVAGVNRSIILGNWDGAITYTDDPILLGWQFHNRHSAAITITYECSLSIHKYVIDLDVFNPPGQ